jgi:hypothetical protein
MIGASALGQMSLVKTSSWSKVAADFSFFDLKGKTVKHKQVKFWSQEKKTGAGAVKTHPLST